MYRANAPRTVALLLSIISFLLIYPLSSCADNPASSTPSTPVQGNSQGAITPNSTLVLPSEGVAAIVPVSRHPNIIVQSGSAVQLTFVGADTENLSTNSYALPYKKQGNTILLNFGQTIEQPLTITMPRAANLTVTLSAGNITVDTIEGKVEITLTNGTITLKKFTPHDASSIEVQSGTIDVSFPKQASCSLEAQTDFGEVVSNYPAIKEKRDGMKAYASGILAKGTGATVKLTAGAGSITISPA